jgi:intracellular sulfur oxidation DsrE/DsrF family protein
MTDNASVHPRRRFLGSAAAVLASFGLGFPKSAHGDELLSEAAADVVHDEWMKPLKGKHRQIFHATAANDIAMLMANNFLDAYSEAFQAKAGEANAVVGVHSGALSIGFNDAAWTKYGIGKTSSVIDPATKEPALRNIFATGGPLSVEASQKRGVVFIMCNTALRMRSRGLAAERGEKYETVYEDLKASRLPGTILVPALVVAINRAQEAGFTYVRA